MHEGHSPLLPTRMYKASTNEHLFRISYGSRGWQDRRRLQTSLFSMARPDLTGETILQAQAKSSDLSSTNSKVIFANRRATGQL